MQKILVSACLLGEPVRYDGKNLRVEDETLRRWMAQDRVVAFCPEVAGGLPVPRIPAEIQGGDGHAVLSAKARVIDKVGNDVSRQFITGAQKALSLCQQLDIKIAILARRSPSCGDQSIYNGEFSGTTIAGAGVTAALLQQSGIRVFNQTTIDEALDYLDESPLNMSIEPITERQFELFWPSFKAIVEAGESYTFDPDMDYAEAYAVWCTLPQVTYAASIDGKVAASYYLKPNAAGPGSHICNCGYMVSAEFRGRGIARALCKHSQQIALERGYKAMQFNSVVSSNAAAVHLWKTLGFEIIGSIPQAYNHKKRGLVDAYIMYKPLLR